MHAAHEWRKQLAAQLESGMIQELATRIQRVLAYFPNTEHIDVNFNRSEWEAVVQALRAVSYDAATNLVKIDDGHSTHARTAAEWLELARRDLSQRAGPTREAEIRADEARQILFALDRYEHASDYGPPIQERIEQHERAATGDSDK